MPKNKRRSHNEGSVYYANYRGRWVAEITTELGKRKRYYCKTEREAIKKKNEVLRELEQGTLATGPQRKLGEYLEDWIENVHRDKLRISAYVKYKKSIRYIVEELGNEWLQKLTPEQVRRFYTKLGVKKEDGGRGLSSKSVHEVHGVLKLALKNAVRWGYIARNVCDLVEPPRVVNREPSPLTLEQAQAFLKSVREHRLEALLTVAVVTKPFGFEGPSGASKPIMGSPNWQAWSIR